MKARAIQLITIILASILTLATQPATPPAQAASEALTNKPATSELLQRFAEEQAKLNSFIAQYEVNRQDAVSAPQAWKGSYTTAGETRFDGQRIRERTRLWGHITPDTVRSKADPYYKSRLFDGQWRFGYEQAFWRVRDPRARPGYVGTLTIQRTSLPPRDLSELLDMAGSGLTLCLGAMPHDAGKRFDTRLRKAATIQVRDKLEPAGAEPSPCYVLEAETTHGHYTVWLDPARGFQIAKAILRRQPGHQRTTGYTLTAGENDLSTVDKVRFAKSGEVWAPIEATGGLDNTFAGGRRTSMRFQVKVTKFLLNPDHEALRSFVPDDIRNGATVYWSEGRKTDRVGLVKYQWRDGKVLDPEGHVALDIGLMKTVSQ
jgi:hypothetical protein